MRLGQLARKLSLRPAEIVEFLAKKNIHIEEGANTRIEDELVNLIHQEFAPGVNIVELEPLPATTEAITPETTIPQAPEPVIHQAEIPVEMPSEVTPVEDTANDVIKAPKIALSGLKVLGKIELPEVRKKDTPDDLAPKEEVSPEPLKTREPERANQRRRDPRPHTRTPKNPIALQREKEAQEEQRKRKEKSEQEKEKRKQNYYKKVKMSPPTKAVRLVDEPTMQMTSEELAEPPKTWIGKFIKWLTT